MLVAVGDEELAVLSDSVAGAVALAEGVAASDAAAVVLEVEPDDATPVPIMLGDAVVSLLGVDPVGCEATPVPKEDVAVPFNEFEAVDDATCSRLEEPVPRIALVVLTAAIPVDRLAAGVV